MTLDPARDHENGAVRPQPARDVVFAGRMRRGARRLTVPPVIGLLGVVSLRAWAVEAVPPPLPLHVEYAAPGNCPTRDDFEARVRARTALARFSDDEGAEVVRVVVTPTGVTYAGHLSITGQSGRTSERDVEDTLCPDVVDALALVTALSVDPNATLSPTAPASSAPTASPIASATPIPTSTLNASPSPTAPVVPLITAPMPAPPRPPAREPEATPFWASKPGTNLGAIFITSAGLAPDALVGGGVFGELESRAEGWFAPSTRLNLLAQVNGAFRTREASFVLLAGRFDVCPVRLGSRRLSLRPCLVADFGAVLAEAIRPSDVKGILGTEGWFDVGVLLRARWAPDRARYFVEAEGGVYVPANRAPFDYRYGESGLAVIDTPWVAGPLGAVAGGVSFW
jgi:hypothetical protein